MRATVRQRTQEKHFFVSGNQVFQGSHSETIGKRKTMEDAATVVGEIFGPMTQYYGLFDGHGGSGVALHLATKLHEKIKEKFTATNNLEESIIFAFTTMNAELVEQYTATGSTASIVIIMGNKMTVANVGDSRVILINGKGNVVRATVDHNVTNEYEKKLIQERGGTIFNNRVNGLISLTRCFGDGTQAGVISCVPSITVIDRHDDDKLIIACDGVSEVMEDDEVGKIFFEQNDPTAAAKAIKDEAVKRGTTDNVTVLCVDLKPKSAN